MPHIQRIMSRSLRQSRTSSSSFGPHISLPWRLGQARVSWTFPRPHSIWQQWHCHSPHRSTAYHQGSRKSLHHQAWCRRHPLRSQCGYRWAKTHPYIWPFADYCPLDPKEQTWLKFESKSFSFAKIHFKMSSAIWWPGCSVLNCVNLWPTCHVGTSTKAPWRWGWQRRECGRRHATRQRWRAHPVPGVTTGATILGGIWDEWGGLPEIKHFSNVNEMNCWILGLFCTKHGQLILARWWCHMKT